jgi:hypothetical protein
MLRDLFLGYGLELELRSGVELELVLADERLIYLGSVRTRDHPIILLFNLNNNKFNVLVLLLN